MLLAFLVVSMLSLAFSIRHVAAIDPPLIEGIKTFGGAEDECAYSVIQTGDGGYALFGHTRSYSRGGADFWLALMSLYLFMALVSKCLRRNRIV